MTWRAPWIWSGRYCGGLRWCWGRRRGRGGSGRFEKVGSDERIGAGRCDDFHPALGRLDLLDGLPAIESSHDSMTFTWTGPQVHTADSNGLVGGMDILGEDPDRNSSRHFDSSPFSRGTGGGTSLDDFLEHGDGVTFFELRDHFPGERGSGPNINILARDHGRFLGAGPRARNRQDRTRKDPLFCEFHKLESDDHERSQQFIGTTRCYKGFLSHRLAV